MIGKASRYWQWRFIYNNASSNEKLKKRSLYEMIKTANNFNDWKFIYIKSFDSKLTKLSLYKMAEHAATFKQIVFVYNESDYKSKLQSNFFYRILESAQGAYQGKIAHNALKEFLL